MSGRVLSPSFPASPQGHTGLETARLCVDLSALRDNYRTLTARAPGTEIGAVVKANAYGLGLAPCALTLWETGARTFFTARLAGGIKLRQILGERPAKIYVLDGVSLQPLEIFAAYDLIPVVSNLTDLHAIMDLGTPLPLALQVDTGMNRLGVTSDQALALAPNIKAQVQLVLSHLASADLPDHPQNALQSTRFAALMAHFPAATLSLSNSSGLFLGDGFAHHLARPGISLYGGGPTGESHPDLKPVAHLFVKVLQRHAIKAGETVGYGAAFHAQSDLELASIGMGYADGLPRSFWPQGYLLHQGVKLPVAGRISMDLATFDVSNAPDIQPGDWLEVFGHALSLDRMAALSGTISYEVLTGLGTRVLRTYEDA